MCGIAGAVWTDRGIPVGEDILDRMTDVLRHRGPDDRGTWYRQQSDGSGAALGHRRLSIIDLNHGRQPISNEDGSVWVTFNGEIYNYRELRKELESAGHRFQTDSDTETIVHLYEEMGERCVDKMRGMFAFAVWDAPRRRLLLARDRLGQKPLVYCEQSGRLLFASEIKGLLQVPGVPREVDRETIDEYLTYLFVPHPRTMFRGIRKLPPGHLAVFEQGRLRVERYWNPAWDEASADGTAAVRSNIERVLDDAVRLRLRSDVPLGAFLSGGIDSTIVVGLMQRHLESPARTYTIGFPVAEFDESAYAQAAADHLKTDHHRLEVQPGSVEILPTLTWHFDEPFADSSAIPTYYVSKLTRQHVKVALTGDGGDELFAGYDRYRTVQSLGRFDRLPGFVKQMIANPLWGHLPVPGHESSLARRLRFRMELLRQTPGRRYVNWLAVFQREQRHALYTDEFAATAARSDPARFVSEATRGSAGRDPGNRAMHADLLTYLPGDLLTKVDIASMAHGLECRSPMLDHHLVELSISTPFEKFTAGEGCKPLLTSTFNDLIPPLIQTRGKWGFRVPLDHWFRHDLRDYARDMLLGSECTSRGYFARNALQELLDQHESGRWNHGDRIWTLLCLELWHKTFVDPAEAPLAPRGDLAPSQWREPSGAEFAAASGM